MATYDSTLRLAHANKLDFSTTFLYYLDNITWKVIPLLQEPVSVNYTIDDSSDNASIRFVSTTLTSKLANGTFVTLVYAPDTTDKSLFGIPTYNGVKPTNHDVLVIKNGRCYQKGNSSIWYHEYQCVELIELLKEVTMETLTFSSDEQITVQYAGAGTSTTYYKNPFNALTILERILKLTRTPTSVEDNSWYNRIAIGDSDWLSTELIGVDDTFNENTLYDALIKLGGYLGRYPVLYFNPDYDTTNEQFTLYFEKRAINRSNPITLASLIANASDLVESDDSPLAQSIVANAQNMIGSKVVYYPSKSQYAPANNQDLEDTEVLATSPLCLVLDYPISQVIQLTKLVYVVQYIGGVRQTPTETYSTIPCFKYEDWLVQDNRNSKAYFKENENIIYFGSSINLSGQGYDVIDANTTQFTYHLFQAQAYTNIQASAYVGDSEYSQFFNQTDNLVDSSTFAQQVKNYQIANSGSDWTASKIVDTYAEILQCGQLVTDNSDEYVISGVSFNTLTQGNKVAYKVAYQLNQDVVRRNLFIKARDGVRNYQTYYENTHERFINIKEKIRVSVQFDELTLTSLNTFKYITDPKIVMGGFWFNEPMVEMAVVKTTSVVDTNSSGTTTETFNKYFQFNCNKTQFGNSVLLNMRALTNVRVGNSVGAVLGGTAYQTQTPAIYTDPFGCVQEMQVGIIPTINEQELMAYNFPIMPSGNYTSLYAGAFIKIPTLYIDKDSREIFNLTLQFDFEPIGTTKISPELIKYSGLLGTTQMPYDSYSFYVLETTPNTYEVGDIGAGVVATISNSSYYNSAIRGMTLYFVAPITLDSSKEYFLSQMINGENKIIAKLDDGSVRDREEVDCLTIYF